MEYFIYQGDKSSGPLSINDLKQRQINATTPIWKQGLEGWVHASTLDELKELFTAQPPPFNPSIPYQTSAIKKPGVAENVGFGIGKIFGLGGVILIVVLLTVYVVSKTYSSHSYIPSITLDPEHSNPATYLYAGGTYKTNFWGNQFVLNGKVTNNATHTNYKDIRVRVSFLSATKSIIASKEYIIYDYVPYGSTKDFTLRLDKPPAVNSCALDAVTAIYY